jgi:hypothetical protein
MVRTLVNRYVVASPNGQVVSSVQEVAPPVTFRIKSQEGLDAKELRIVREDAGADLDPAPGEVIVRRHLVSKGWPSAEELTNDHVPGVFRVEPGEGAFQWLSSTYGPHVQTPMHATETLDLQYVAAGEVDLVLDDGEIHLCEGDSVLLSGGRHAWRTGELGCTRVGLILGRPQAG